ncbi:MAG: MFS transporter, partial [Methylobacteriaceae bacterium]|nr:MFS transporter [Methylobacteriaceae bacterium]
MSNPAPDSDRLKRRIVIGVLSAMALATLDQTIVAPALPSIGAEFGGSAYLPWVIAAYLVTSTAVTPLYGKIADARGRKPALFAAIAIFLVGALASAAAQSLPMLIAGRAVQGLGGGGLIALAQTVIADVVSPRERGRYVGYISAVWAGSSVLGPTLGGLLAEYAHWKLIFLLNLPLALLAFALSARALRSLPDRREPRPIDIAGAALVIGATALVLMALTWAGRAETSRTLAPAAFVGGLLLAAVLRAHLRRAADPLIPLRLFANPVVRSGAGCIFFGFGGYLGLSVIVPFYLVSVAGVSATQAGMALMAMLVGAVIGANTAGRTMARLSAYRRIGAFGMGLAVCATAALAARAPDAGFLEIE